MTLIADKLKDLAGKFKRTSGIDEKKVENMKKVAEAAKQAGREAKGSKE